MTPPNSPFGLAITSDGSKVYVANKFGNTVSVIDTVTNKVVGSPIPVGNVPLAFGKFIQPFIAFSAFAPDLTVYPVPSRFSIKGSFTLGAASNGINPPTEPVTLKIGSFNITIPPGSFVNAGPRNFTFVGVVNNVSLNVMIRLASGNSYIFQILARNAILNQNPVPVTLMIGDDSGTTRVNAVIINTGSPQASPF
jgi:YVTN family beta-propeller protein